MPGKAALGRKSGFWPDRRMPGREDVFSKLSGMEKSIASGLWDVKRKRPELRRSLYQEEAGPPSLPVFCGTKGIALHVFLLYNRKTALALLQAAVPLIWNPEDGALQHLENAEHCCRQYAALHAYAFNLA